MVLWVGLDDVRQEVRVLELVVGLGKHDTSILHRDHDHALRGSHEGVAAFVCAGGDVQLELLCSLRQTCDCQVVVKSSHISVMHVVLDLLERCFAPAFDRYSASKEKALSSLAIA